MHAVWNMELPYIFIHYSPHKSHHTTSNISSKITTTNPLTPTLHHDFHQPYNYRQSPLYKHCIYNNIHSNNYQQDYINYTTYLYTYAIAYLMRVSSDQSYQGFKHPSYVHSSSSVITSHHHLSTTIHHYSSSSLITSHINVHAYIHHHYYIHITCIEVCNYTTILHSYTICRYTEHTRPYGDIWRHCLYMGVS